MEDLIIILILLIVIAIGVKGTVKHFRLEGGCCGGSASRPKKKKLKNKIIGTYVFHIEDMKCKNCVNTVTSAINEIAGASAKVNLKKKTAVVSFDKELDAQAVMDAVAKRGYRAEQIR